MFREFVVARDRLRAEASRDLTLAWLTARYGRGKLSPLAGELRKLIATIPSTRDQAIAEQRTALEMLSERYGIPLQRGKPESDGVWLNHRP